MDTSSISPRRSLNLPAASYPPVQSALPASSYPTVQSALHASSYPPVQSALDAYTQHPEAATLDQIMLHYLDMEEILKLYRQNYEQFETKQALNTLALKYKLPTATTFKQLLRAYDMQYATVRSYLYDNRTPSEILYQAALEGNIQALYNQLKLYPKLRKQSTYTTALKQAAEGGHRAIIELLLELGATNKDAVLKGATQGGHLAIVKEELDSKKNVELSTLENLAYLAALNNRTDVLEYILSINTANSVREDALRGAGVNGGAEMIEYLAATSLQDYTALVQGAAFGGHLDIVKKYLDRVDPDKYNDIYLAGGLVSRLDVVSYLLDKGVIDTNTLYINLIKYKRNYKSLAEHVRTVRPPTEVDSSDSDTSSDSD